LLRQTGEDALQILKDVIIPKAQHSEFILRKPIVTFDVANGICVLAAIDFDDQS
jgi:hypothetical protein